VVYGERPTAWRGEEEEAEGGGQRDRRDAVVGERPEVAVNAELVLCRQEEQGNASAGGVRS
jgi:hypothetical protein